MGELGGGSWSAFGMGLRWRWGVGLRIIFGGKVENGVDSFFWTDPWLGEIPLSIRFLRLFKLSVNRWMTVADMFSLGWGEGWKFVVGVGGGAGRGVYEFIANNYVAG